MEPKPRKYAARVKLTVEGVKRARYFSSQNSAVTMYRDLNMRLIQSGRPPKAATLEPVRCWQGLLEPAQLTVSRAGAVVVHRPAANDDFRTVAAPVWPPCGVSAGVQA